MKTIIHIFLLSPLFLHAQSWQAAKRYAQGTATALSASAVAVGPDSSIYVAGSFIGTVAFDGITLSPLPGNAENGFLLKLAPGLQAVWAKSFPQKAYDVTTDANGNVFVAGSQYNDSLTFVAQFAGTDGQLLASFFSTGGRSRAKALDLDAAGNCYVAGWMDAPATFGGITPATVGGREAFLLRLSPDLAQVHWAVLTGASSKLDEVDDVEVDDANGFVYACGNYSQSYQLIPCFCYNGSFFVEKHEAATGASVWKNIFAGGSGTATRQRLSVDPDGTSVYTAASFKHTVTVPPGISLTAENNGNYHIFMTRLDASSGSADWAVKTAVAGDNYPQGLVWADSQLFQHGYFTGVTVMANDTFIPQGGYDPFFAAVSPVDGGANFAESFNGSGSDLGTDVAASGNQLVVCGNANSGLLNIGSFALSGNSGFYVARRVFSSSPSPTPVAMFEADVLEGCAPLTVEFTNTSSGDPGTFAWSFPGGLPASSTEVNPVVTYNQPGNYAVSLTATNAFGGNTLNATNYIAVQTVPTAAFTYTVDGLSLGISNLSQNAESCSWNFGDGTGSTDCEPAHVYADTGLYLVELTTVNSCGASVLQQEILVGASSSHEPQWMRELRILPNPADGWVTLDWPTPPEPDLKIDILDATGRSVWQTQMAPAAAAVSFDCSVLPAGLYILRMEGNGRAGVRRLLVAH